MFSLVSAEYRYVIHKSRAGHASCGGKVPAAIREKPGWCRHFRTSKDAWSIVPTLGQAALDITPQMKSEAAIASSSFFILRIAKHIEQVPDETMAMLENWNWPRMFANWRI